MHIKNVKNVLTTSLPLKLIIVSLLLTHLLCLLLAGCPSMTAAIWKNNNKTIQLSSRMPYITCGRECFTGICSTFPSFFFFFFTTEVVVAGIILCSLRGEGLLQEGVGSQCGGDCGRQLCYFSLQLTSLFLSLR